MKKKYINAFIVFMAIYFLPLDFLAQTNQNHQLGYQKDIKFHSAENVQKAKQNFKTKYGLDDNTTFQLIQTNRDRTGTIHQKYQQYFKGVKVEYGTMIVHMKDGNVTSINGELYNPEDLNLTSRITPQSAFQKATSHVGAQRFLWDDAEAAKNMAYEKPTGELVIFPVIGNNYDVTLKLAFKYDIYATFPVSRGNIYIDAKSGSFIFNDPIIKHYQPQDHKQQDHKLQKTALNTIKTQNNSLGISVSGSADTRYSGTRTIETRAETNGTFTLNDDTRNVHTYNAQNASKDSNSYFFTTVDFVDNDNNWTTAEFDNLARDNAALDAHWGAIKVYDFWQLLGRNSYDDQGAEIRSYVHVDVNYYNAYWNGSVMSYGDGSPNPLTSIDVCAHEIAHAVTTWTANLVYARESGALNEAFSDIFGAAIEFYAKGTESNTSPNANTWLIGEDFASPLRSMSDPNSKGDPDTYNGNFYIDASSSCIPVYSGPDYNDGCGVHTNSGVLNHWFYILVAGEAGTNDAGDIYNVTGIGMSKAQEIAYLMLRDYLSPNATYMDARNAAIDVATSLYGSNSVERKATQDAFYAVNLGEEFVPYPTDLKLEDFSQLTDITCGEPVTPKINIRNTGASNAINNIQINYSIDGVAQTPFNWSGTLAVDQQTEITLPAINETTIKSYNLIVDSVVSGDGDRTNNSLSGTFRVNKSDNTPTVVNTFENLLVDYWLTYNEGGGSNLWVLGNPNKATLNTTASGSKAYITGTAANYTNDTKAYLISPCYDLTTLTNPIMKFDMAFQLEENYDILYVEYSKDAKNWYILGSASDPNWYNSDRKFVSAEISTDCENCPGAQWTGTNSVLTQYSYDLSALKLEPKINFRFVFHSNSAITDEGVVIDDFVINDGTLGILDFGLTSNQVKIYPNPSINIFNISFLREYSNLDIDIFDITGKLILSKKRVSLHNKTYTLDLSSFAKGLYFAKFNVEDTQITKKLILE